MIKDIYKLKSMTINILSVADKQLNKSADLIFSKCEKKVNL